MEDGNPNYGLLATLGKEQAEGRATPSPVSANDRQVGGAHYTSKEGVQHWDLVAMLHMDYFIGNATKYLARGHLKNGRQDYAKAVHYIDKRAELGWDLYLTSDALVAWEFCMANVGMPIMAQRAFMNLIGGRPHDAREAALWLQKNYEPATVETLS